MRYKELLEYKRDITANNLGEKFLSRLENDNSVDSDYDLDLSDESELQEFISRKLEQVEKADPTPNKQYTEWLVRRYIDGSISRFEDALSTWADFLHEYHTLKIHRQLPQQIADINRFKGRDSALRLMLRINTLYDEFQTARNEKEVMPKGDAKEILNNSEVRIIIPNDEASACYYGQGTRWCTAAKNNNMFGGYSSHNHPLFILLPKNPTHDGEKYQVHLRENEWMDEEDTEVGAQEVIERFSNTDLKSVFEKYDTDANLILEFLSWRTITYTIDEITELIVKNKNVILSDWLSDTTQGNINAHRKIIDGMSSLHPTDEILDAMWENYGEWRMKLYELPDAYAKWLEYEFHIDGGFYDFVHGNIEATVDSKGQPIVRIG
jgi:hypothetical protein